MCVELGMGVVVGLVGDGVVRGVNRRYRFIGGIHLASGWTTLLSWLLRQNTRREREKLTHTHRFHGFVGGFPLALTLFHRAASFFLVPVPVLRLLVLMLAAETDDAVVGDGVHLVTQSEVANLVGYGERVERDVRSLRRTYDATGAKPG